MPYVIETFVAIGDSFTEGLDDFNPDGTVRGWADRVAELLAAEQGHVNYGQPGRTRQGAAPDRRRPVPDAWPPDRI